MMLRISLFLTCLTVANATIDWSQWGRNAQFTSALDVKVTNPALQRRQQWNFKAGDRVVGSPAVGLGRVCFGSDDGLMRCVDKASGSLLWQFQVAPGSDYCESAAGANQCEHGVCACNKIRSSPAMGKDGSLIFGSYDFNVYKLDKDGKLVWKVATGGAVYGGVTLDEDGTAFVGSFDSKVYAISPEGTIKWSTDIGAHGDSGWTIGKPGTAAENFIFGQSNEGGYCTSWPPPDCPSKTHSPGGSWCYVIGIHKLNGTIAWQQYTGTPGGGGMMSMAGDLYITGSWNDYVVAYEPVTGKVKWYFDAENQIESHPASSLDGKLVYISTESDPGVSGTLFALEVATGKMLWNYTGAGEEMNSSPTVTADTVYVGSNDKYIHAVEVGTGKLRFKYLTCANVFSSAAVDLDGMVYIGCNTETGPTSTKGLGRLYAINPAKQSV